MWELRSDGLYVSPPLAADQDDPTALVRLCERVEVVAKNVDLLSGKESLDISIQTPYAEKRFTINRDDIDEKRIIPTLTVQGLSILSSDESAAVIKEVLICTEENAPVYFVHNALGFYENPFDKRLCFFWHHPIGGQFTKTQRCSTFEDPRLTAPKGAFGEWRKFVIDKVARSTPLSLALAMGSVSLVASELKASGAIFENPIFSIIGDSSTGKSSILFLISSLWANPRYFIGNFNATSNAFSAMMSFKAVPFLADEATHTPNIDLDDIAYSVPAGREKRRCTGDGKLKPMVEYDSCMVVTSEKSLLDRLLGHGGEYARIIEFNLAWFRNGDEADNVKEFCAQNFGWAVTPMITLLLKDGFRKKLMKKYRHYVMELKESVGEIKSGIRVGNDEVTVELRNV